MEGGAQWWATGLENRAGHTPRVRLLHFPPHAPVAQRLSRGLLSLATWVRVPPGVLVRHHLPLAQRIEQRRPKAKAPRSIRGRETTTADSNGPLAQRWCGGLLIQRFRVRAPGGPLAGWRTQVARWFHTPEVPGSNPGPATNFR